jgi:hypothetical protein
VLAKKQWPKVRFKEKRAITFKEHQAIIENEQNAERRAYYEFCWHLGGAQSDAASLRPTVAQRSVAGAGVWKYFTMQDSRIRLRLDRASDPQRNAVLTGL